MSAKKRLKEIREYLGLSQQKLADSLEMKVGSINSIEGGNQKEFSLALAYTLYSKHNINLEWLLYGTGDMILPKKNTLELRYLPLADRLKNWGKRLQQIQIQNDLTDEQFAKIIDISLKRFLKLCLDSPKPDFEEIFNILENFDVTMDWLLLGNEKTEKKSQAPIGDLRLSPEKLKKLMKILDD